MAGHHLWRPGPRGSEARERWERGQARAAKPRVPLGKRQGRP